MHVDSFLVSHFCFSLVIVLRDLATGSFQKFSKARDKQQRVGPWRTWPARKTLLGSGGFSDARKLTPIINCRWRGQYNFSSGTQKYLERRFITPAAQNINRQPARQCLIRKYQLVEITHAGTNPTYGDTRQPVCSEFIRWRIRMWRNRLAGC